jgi:hypothetical protein
MLGFVSNTKQKNVHIKFFQRKRNCEKPNVHVKAMALDWDVLLENIDPL